MKKTFVVACMAIALICHACTGNYSAEQDGKETAVENVTLLEPEQTDKPEQNGIPAAPIPPEKFKKQQPAQSESSSEPYANWDRKIVRTAEVETEVPDLNSYTLYLRNSIRSLGGYIAQEDYSRTEYRNSSRLTLKIPVHLFEEGMKMITEKAGEVKAVKISSQDVSTEMVDIKARLEVRGRMRDRYLQLMAGAKNMDELLKVQNEVQGLQEEIESGSSRLNFLNHSSAMSTIQLSAVQVLKEGSDAVENPEEKHPIISAFLTGWGILRDLMLALLTVWPLLLAGGLLWMFVRKRKMVGC